MRKIVFLSTSFSWDQMGEFDLPALIEYVTSQSVQDEIFYIGHSMGTTSFMVMANKHPQLQEKIKHARYFGDANINPFGVTTIMHLHFAKT